ncbi:MAG: galactokinase [Phycisphaeraceae bacterium]
MPETIPDTLTSQLETTRQAFIKAFGDEPTIAAVAPGRVNLIGEHTDYNGGFVLPMAIERQTVVMLRPRGDKQARLRSTALPGEAVFPVDIDGDTVRSAPITLGEPDWSRYLRGVVAFSYTPRGFDLMLDSNVPPGGGLSSSASIELATATALEALGGIRFDPVVKAKLCQMAEHRYGGTPCGIMDQFISAMGKAGCALLIDCRDDSTRDVPMDDASLSVLIINSNVKHELSGGEYAERRAQCETAARTLGVSLLRDADMSMLDAAKDKLDDVVYRRARHVITEDQRTLAFADALKAGDLETAGQAMFASHASLRDDYEVSTPELDLLVSLAEELVGEGEVIGARMTGGGFGGCTVNLVRADKADTIARRITEAYHAKTGVEAPAFVTRPAQGARLLEIG